MKKSYTVSSGAEAWKVADSIFPTDYMKDSEKSSRAGYDIFYSTLPGCAAWISDLGNRLEVNTADGETVNIWIEETGAEETGAEETAQNVEATKTAEKMTVCALYAPEVCQRVTLCIDGGIWAGEDEKRVYDAIKRGHPSILFDLLTRYAETHGIAWGTISGVKAAHYDHGNGRGGHYIVSGYISSRIGAELDFLTSCAEAIQQAARDHAGRTH